MNVNGNGVSSATGKQLLQIIPINIITVITMVVCSVGLYYKFDARIAALEKSSASTDLAQRVTSVEKKLDDVTPRIIRTDTNVLWLMSKGSNIPRE